MMDNDTNKTEIDPTEGVAAADTGAAAGAQPDGAADAVDESAALAALRQENAELKDRVLRALAEVENIRRRAERDREDTAKFAISKFARDLLEVADNLRRALDAVPAEARQEPNVATLLEGVAATERELLGTFEKHGLIRVDPADQKFDPNFHQAMFEVPNSGKLPGTVVQVLVPGYLLNGRLLRPAMVGVAVGEAPQKVDTTA